MTQRTETVAKLGRDTKMVGNAMLKGESDMGSTIINAISRLDAQETAEM